MIADSFEIDGEEVDIHIVDNKAENCFSIIARNRNGELLNGFEFRVKKIRDIAAEFFSQGAPAFAIVSFMRRQIEENHWQVYREEGLDVPDAGSAICPSAREEGRKAFLNKEHYCTNPFTELNRVAHDEWDRGWAEEAQKNPGRFDFSIDSFQE
jgi:hypothetical protein